MKQKTSLFILFFAMLLIACGDGEPVVVNPVPSNQLSAEEFEAYVEQNFQACDENSDCTDRAKGCDDSCMFLALNESFIDAFDNLSCDESQLPCSTVGGPNYTVECIDQRCTLAFPE